MPSLLAPCTVIPRTHSVICPQKALPSLGSTPPSATILSFLCPKVDDDQGCKKSMCATLHESDGKQLSPEARLAWPFVAVRAVSLALSCVADAEWTIHPIPLTGDVSARSAHCWILPQPVPVVHPLTCSWPSGRYPSQPHLRALLPPRIDFTQL